mgnify:CR=1 FL=1
MGMNTRYVKEYFYKKKIRSMFVWILEIIAAILLAAAFSWFFCRSVVVRGGLDGATLVPGERVLMDSAWYRLSSPKRGDIIAFRTSEDKKASIHIKRVIALPGETVQIKDGQILINGEVYNEKDEFPAITNAGLASERSRSGRDSTLCSATTGTTARTAATTAWDSWIRTALSESSGLRFRRGRKSVSCKRSIEGEET